MRKKREPFKKKKKRRVQGCKKEGCIFIGQVLIEAPSGFILPYNNTSCRTVTVGRYLIPGQVKMQISRAEVGTNFFAVLYEEDFVGTWCESFVYAMCFFFLTATIFWMKLQFWMVLWG